MRPIKLFKTALVVVLGFSAHAETNTSDFAYQQKPIVSIEYREGQQLLINQETTVGILKGYLNKVSDGLILVTAAAPNDQASITLANNRLTLIKTDLVKAGVAASNVDLHISLNGNQSDQMKVYLVDSRWQSLPSSIIQSYIASKPGTKYLKDASGGLLENSVNQVLIADRNIRIELTELIVNKLGWAEVELSEVPNFSLSEPIEMSFDAVYLPVNEDFMLDLLETVKLQAPELNNVYFRIFPKERKVVAYKKR